MAAADMTAWTLHHGISQSTATACAEVQQNLRVQQLFDSSKVSITRAQNGVANSQTRCVMLHCHGTAFERQAQVERAEMSDIYGKRGGNGGRGQMARCRPDSSVADAEAGGPQDPCMQAWPNVACA